MRIITPQQAYTTGRMEVLYRVFVIKYIGRNKVKLDTKSGKYYDAQKEWASLQGNAAYVTGRMKLLAESCWKVFWIKTHLNLTQEAANTVMCKKNENYYTQMQALHDSQDGSPKCRVRWKLPGKRKTVEPNTRNSKHYDAQKEWESSTPKYSIT